MRWRWAGLVGRAGLRLRRRRWRIARTVVEMPGHVKDASAEPGELLEEPLGHVEATVRATGALVHDGRADALALVGDGDRFEALRTRVTTPILGGVERDDMVGGLIGLSTRAEANIIPRGTTIEVTFGKEMCGIVARHRLGFGQARSELVVTTRLRHTDFVRRRRKRGQGENQKGLHRG